MNTNPLDHLRDDRAFARLSVLTTALTAQVLASGGRIPVLEKNQWFWVDKSGSKIRFDEHLPEKL